MPELNFIATSAQDTAGAKGLVQQPYLATAAAGYSYGGAGQPSASGFMEFGTGTPGALPFRVDQDGNVTAKSFATGTPGSGSLTLALQASTGDSGTALVNGTPTILSWTTPNDGHMHRAMVFGALAVTVTETGGLINLTYMLQGSSALHTSALVAANQAATTAGVVLNTVGLLLLAPNTTISVVQGSALTAGAATLYAEIWGA